MFITQIRYEHSIWLRRWDLPDELPTAPLRDIYGAGYRGRTGTLLSQHWILSPRRLPVPPHRLGKRNAQPFFHCLYIISSRAVFVKCFFIFFTALRLFSCDILRLLCLFTFVRQYFNKCTTLLCYNRHNERVSSAAAAAVERFLT